MIGHVANELRHHKFREDCMLSVQCTCFQAQHDEHRRRGPRELRLRQRRVRVRRLEYSRGIILEII